MKRWKRVKDYPKYLISNEGDVKSLWIEKILKPSRDKGGYLRIWLYNTKEDKRIISISRLVAQEFIPNPHNLPQVNHKDGVKSNNKSSNLEWCTGSYNTKHAFDIGLCTHKGTNNSNAKLTENDIHVIRSLFDKMTSIKIAKEFNVSSAMISCIKQGKNWAHVSKT